jgi:hypothetical protein
VSTVWADASLHGHAVTTSMLSAARTHGLYGHFRTATQMDCVPDTYWQKELTTAVTMATTTLNDPTMTANKSLDMLYIEAIGGILVITQFFDEKGGRDPLFITILATPLVATYDTTMSPEKGGHSGQHIIGQYGFSAFSNDPQSS